MDNIIYPLDEHNKKLLENVHPENYKNPVPKKIYDLVVIGAGTAGLVTAAASCGLGAKVALIEKALMGGDCLNFGCVPSKAIISSSRIAYELQRASIYGINNKFDRNDIDFKKIMERMRKKRSYISKHDSVKRFNKMGVDVFIGNAKFTGKNTIQVNEKTILKFRKAAITTGATPAIPQIEGLEKSGYLTNETIFSLTELPEKLAVIGGGPIGCELAQTFRRFGSDVVIIHNNRHLLNREDKEAALIVQNQFLEEGIKVILNTKIIKVQKNNKTKTIFYVENNKEKALDVSDILIATGRIPNCKYLELENAGVKYDKNGIIVNDKLETSNKRIYSAGDVSSKYKFTHAADYLARIVIQNALFNRGAKASLLIIPWCTYTEPELAHVGLSEDEAIFKDIKYDKFFIDFKELDRAIVSGKEKGFVKILTKKGSDKIIGSTIITENAGDLISEVTIAMVHKIGLSGISSVIHPYPTIADAIRKSGDIYNRTKLTSFTAKLLKLLMWFGLRV